MSHDPKGIDNGYFGENVEFSPNVFTTLRPITLLVRDRAHSLFAASRLSSDPTRYGFRSIRQILAATPLEELEPSLKRVYTSWLKLEGKEAFDTATKAPLLRQEHLQSLIEVGDPAIFAIHSLEKIRTTDYPALYREVDQLARVHISYDLVLSGIHGRASQQELTRVPRAS